MTRPSAPGRSSVLTLVALSLYALARCLPVAAGLDRTGQAVIGVALFGMVLWMSEAVPLGVTALSVIVLLGTVPGLRPAHVFGGFAFPVVFFLIGAVGMAAAIEQTGLARRAARRLLAGAGGRPSRLYFQMLVSLPGLALFVPSAITRNAILVPAYREALSAMGLGATDRRARAVMLALGVLNPIASSALLTGGIASMTAASLIGGFSWLGWFSLMAVPYYALLLLGGLVLWFTAPAAEREARPAEPLAPAPALSRSERITIAVLVLTGVLWLTDAWHGLTPAIPALLAAVLLLLPRVGVIAWKELESRLSWALILTVGASLSLANAMSTSTAGPWLGRLFTSAVLHRDAQPLVFVPLLIVMVAVVHLAITNLAACLALLLPIAMTAAREAGLNPVASALIATVAVDAVILYPVQTATNLLAYETGYFTAGDVRRFGLTMLALTILVMVAVTIPYWALIGFPLRN